MIWPLSAEIFQHIGPAILCLIQQAAGAARFELAMTEIARLEGIDVTDDDVEQKYAELSAQYQLSRDLLRQQLPPLRLRHDLKLARAQAVVVDSARRK